MRKINFGILIILIAIGGVALSQVGNVCTAENVIQDTTIEVPAHEYREVCAIGRLYTSQIVDQYPAGYGPVYKVSVEAWDSDEDQYKPIDLLILDSVAYKKFQKGEKFE